LEATRLSCAIRSRFRNPDQGQTDRRGRHPPSLNQGRTQVIFCVRGVVSPLLANIYLHYVFDLWVHRWRGKWAQGDMIVVRYADDAVLGFEQRKDAEAYLEQLRERIRKFGLELHAEKTRLLEFGRFAEDNRKRRGEGKPETFDFLGFTHICGKTRKGSWFTVKRQTVKEAAAGQTASGTAGAAQAVA
jgi:hypothetical protein